MCGAGTNMVAQYNWKVFCKISFYLTHQIFSETNTPRMWMQSRGTSEFYSRVFYYTNEA
jgi:hypothetical protein